MNKATLEEVLLYETFMEQAKDMGRAKAEYWLVHELEDEVTGMDALMMRAMHAVYPGILDAIKPPQDEEDND